MEARLFSREQFLATMTAPVVALDVNDPAYIDIWPYVAAIPMTDFEGHEPEGGAVERAYRSAEATFDHALIPTGTRNVYVVIIVDLKSESVAGHYLLDLNKEYGLT